MEPSNSLKIKATEEIIKGSSSFQFGGTLYFVDKVLPESNVSTFFTVSLEGTVYAVYSLRN